MLFIKKKKFYLNIGDCVFEMYAISNWGFKSLYIVEGCHPVLGNKAINSTNLTEAIIPQDVMLEDDAFVNTNRLTIYTPAGSYAEQVARKSFISINTTDYDIMKEEYKKQYDHLLPEITPTPTPLSVLRPTCVPMPVWEAMAPMVAMPRP